MQHALRTFYTFILCAAGLLMLVPAHAQSPAAFDTSLYRALDYRSIGPFRGGRAAAAAGIPGQPDTYYFGATGGGVWKTTNGGETWRNVSDGYFGGSIGAVAVSEWDPNVVYVGGGEVTVRGNVSHGYGMWKSVDAGKTWQQIGLEDSRHIVRLQIHPKNPDVVYAAALGHLYGPNEQRGVYRTTDGGETWTKILGVSDEVGAVDVEMDPTNPRILYASMWRVKRTPYSLSSGGEGSSIWKSTDGGDNWTEITRNEGLPQGIIGISGISVSPTKPSRVYAIIEANDGGVFRSENGGKTWTRVNKDRNLRQRAWYYTRIYADPQDADKVYVLNVEFWRSTDGGESFESIETPHVDHHDLWISPENPSQMVVADDGGGQVTYDGGETWSTYYNQPTAQFYRVTVDDSFPYRIYGAQQDNSTVRIAHRSDGQGITEDDWEPTAGGESGWIAPKPGQPDTVFGGSYGGFLERLNHNTGESRVVNVWPENPMGHGVKDMKIRFQWNFPILYSQHQEDVLYTAGNKLFTSTDGGESWNPISPDLTRADTSKMGSSGGPITKDNTGVEYYATIFTVAESPHEEGVIWTGSDDGLIHITRDGGSSWQNITPRDIPEFIQINSIEADPFEPGGLYVAATMYKWDDFAPYLYRTKDYGQTWTKITRGIDDEHFTRVVRADPERQGLLYAGTESGMYVSFDDGDSWTPFQRNLPIVPITDLAVKDNDLVVATQGRSFWVMDDLTPLHQLDGQIAEADMALMQPRPAYRIRGAQVDETITRGQNPPSGVMLNYVLGAVPDSGAIALRIMEEDGTLIKTFTPKGDEDDRMVGDGLPMQEGLNRFAWDLRYPEAKEFEGMILWGGMPDGPVAVPGMYQARLVVGDDSATVPFEVKADPRSASTLADLQAQFDFIRDANETLTETHESIEQIRTMRSDIRDVISRVEGEPGGEQIKEQGEAIIETITAIEETLYQTKNQSRQDPLNYPIRLNNKLSSLARGVAVGGFRPTEQAYAVKEELTQEINTELSELQQVMETDVPAFNQLVREQNVPAVSVGQPAKPQPTSSSQ